MPKTRRKGKTEATVVLPAGTTDSRGSSCAITLMDIGLIRPYDRNPRVNDAGVDAVAESIRRFGFRQPIVVDGRRLIICGHTRWKAAQKLGLAKVPVHVAADLTQEEIRAYRIADNKTADLSGWNADLLAGEMIALQAADVDLTGLGFTADELAGLLYPGITDGRTDPDEVPLPPDAAVTQPGDLWLMGDQRLLCGDSGNLADVDRLLDGAPVHLVNTDPPYNIHIESRSINALVMAKRSRPHVLVSDHKKRQAGRTNKQLKPRDCLTDRPLSKQGYGEKLSGWFGNIARVLVPGRSFYLWGGLPNLTNYPPALAASGMHLSQLIVWVKNQPSAPCSDFIPRHESCFYGWRKGAPHKWFGPRNIADVWEVPVVHRGRTVHLSEKPVELAARALQYSSRPGENVLDLFGGSGSTLIAAQQSGRRAFLMEIDPLYCDVILNRWEKFSGQKAECRRPT